MTEFRICQHSVAEGRQVVEVWIDGQFMATITAADTPGVRVLSRHRMVAVDRATGDWLRVTEIRILADPLAGKGGTG